MWEAERDDIANEAYSTSDYCLWYGFNWYESLDVPEIRQCYAWNGESQNWERSDYCHWSTGGSTNCHGTSSRLSEATWKCFDDHVGK